MEKSGNVKDAKGITTVGKNPNLVSWDLGYRRDDSGVVSFDVFITFSSKARAKTWHGDKQDSHTSAYALNLAQTMKIVKDTVPKEENDFSGIDHLVNEIALIPRRDYFFCEKFNVMPKSTNAFATNAFGRELRREIDEQRNTTKAAINALDQAVSSAQMYQTSIKKSTTSLKASNETDQRILDSLKNTDTQRLKDLKRGARREYSLNVATKAAEKLLNYQNTAPYVTFPEVPTNEEKEIKFRKAEGSRVKRALGTLIAYSSSDLSVVQDFANEEYLLDEEVLPNAERVLGENIEDVPDAEDLAASTSSAAQQHQSTSLLQRPKRNAAKFANLNVGTLTKQNVIHQPKSVEDKDREEKNKKNREAKKIVKAICDLLYYPPLNKEDLENIVVTKQQNARTNDIGVFCYVLTRHLAIILETFNRLDGLEDKDAIINGFLNKMLDDWRAVIDDAQIGQLNENATLEDKKGYMKNEIKAALNDWGQEKRIIREEQKQKERLISSSEPAHSNDNDTDSTVNSHSSLNFSLSYPPIASDQKKREEFQQSPNKSPNIRAAAAASYQRKFSQASMLDTNKSSHTELQQRDLSQLRTPTKSDQNALHLWPATMAAATASAARRKNEATKVESNQNKKSETGPSNTSHSNSSNKKGTTPS